MAHILVTGGKGFLGDHLVARLLHEGHDVRILARQKGHSDNGDRQNCPIIWGDIRDAETVDKAVEGMDFVFHLVSNFRKGGSDKKEAHAINVEGTSHVLNACLKHGVKQLLHCSTIGVHGSVKSIPANENTEFNPGDLYQETKLLAEKRVWEFSKINHLPVTVIRPISMYGPGDLRMLKLFKMIKAKRFVMVGSGEALFQPAYIDDVIQGFMKCLNNEKAIGEAFIIGNEEYLPLKDLCSLIADALNVPPPKIRIPLWPVQQMAGLCEKVCAGLGVEPPLHRRRVSFFVNNRAFSIDKAKKLIGYRPETSLKEGIRKTIRWYEDNNYM